MKNTRRRCTVAASSLLVAFGMAAVAAAADREPLVATDVRSFASERLGLTVVSGEIPLPQGRWEAAAVTPAGLLDQVQVSQRVRLDARQEGERSRWERVEQTLFLGREPFWRIYNALGFVRRAKAAERPGTLEAALEELRTKHPEEHKALTAQVLSRSPYPDGAGAQGPFYALFPAGVPLQGTTPTVFAAELRPWIDDGRHWVLLNNGVVERREIDRRLLQAHGAVVRPILAGVRDPNAPAAQAAHLLRGILRDPRAAAASITLREAGTGETREVRWALAGAAAGDQALLAAWARDRAQRWQVSGEGGGAPVLRTWVALTEKLYGTVPAEPGASPPREEEPPRRDADRSTDVFDMLGGRAALDETLQMQLLGSAPRPPEDLVGAWSFDDCDGKAAGNRWLKAEVVGAPACVPGVAGSALEFAGGAHVKVSSMSNELGGLTVAAWVRLAGEVGPTAARIVGQEEAEVMRGEAQRRGWGLSLFGDGHRGATGNVPVFHWAAGGQGGRDAGEFLAAGVALAPGKWHHVAATLSPGKATLYVDGAEVGVCERPVFAGNLFSAPLGIASAVADTPATLPLAGAVDEVRIYRRALPAAEARELYAPRTEPIPIAEIAGVQVKSHPFAELLAGKEGFRLPLADAVPADRFLLWFAKPSAVFPFIEDGADFLFRAGSLATRSWVDDDLKGRYLRRLGLGEKQGRRFLESGEVTELAIVAPDLFFIDGTDVTVIMRVRRPDKVGARLKDLGVAALPADGLVEKRLEGGRSAWWGRRGDLILVGTSKVEAQASLDLLARGGEGSLGRSAELRYMLSRQEPGAETRAVAYFSDDFVRRLTGPAVKIGQLRRMRDRGLAVRVTAGALLHRLDQGREERDLGRLEQLGYTPQGLAAQGWTLRQDLAAVSPAWGTVADADTLGAHPVQDATPEEGRLYKEYVDQYARYWRQYFDPIAVRLDDARDGDLALSVFILPLVDSQLYGQVRQTVAGASDQAPLRVPRFAPEPVLQLSLNVREEAWRRLTRSFGSFLTRYTGISPALFDHLGPGFHFALQDADPVLVLGNGDLLGLFGRIGVGGGSEGFGIPMLLSALTRPCTLAVQLKDPAAVLALLRQAVSSGQRDGRRRDLRAGFRQVGDRDAWILTVDVAGFARLRFGIEVRDGHLIVSNLPWARTLEVKAVEEQPLRGAALRVASGAVRLGLPALFATQQEQNQVAALKGIAALEPLLATGAGDPSAATRLHAALFGASPLHPDPGAWTWQGGRLASSVYGDAARWRQAPWRDDGEDFGLLAGVEKVAVGMQFEDEGLRARIVWTPAK